MSCMPGINKIIMQILLHSDATADTSLSSNRKKPLKWKQVQFSFLLLDIKEQEKYLRISDNFR